MDLASRRAVLERLTALDDMAVQVGGAVSASTARSQLRWTVASWRALLAAHQPTSRGRCPACSGRLRGRKWPCQVWLTAHQQLIGEGHGEQRPAPAPRAPARRPREVEIVPRGGGSREPEQQPSVPPMRTAASPEPSTTSGEIHRAAVTERRPAMPRPRTTHRLHG